MGVWESVRRSGFDGFFHVAKEKEELSYGELDSFLVFKTRKPKNMKATKTPYLKKKKSKLSQ